jgi:hypothetical protein
MRKVLAVLVIAFVITVATQGGADSPVTSTPFHQAYLDIGIVKEAKASGVLTEKIFSYLSSPENPIDVKAAIINALGWKLEGKSNCRTLYELLAQKREVSLQTLIDHTELLGSDELFCLGYLQLMDDYFHPEKAIPLLELAYQKRPKSFTVSIVFALARAQLMMDSNWCQVWKITDEVLQNERLNEDLRPAAKKIIIDYMILYKSECD